MALAPETKAFYSPTSTPILDVLRPAPHRGQMKLTAGEYFFLSSLLIVSLTTLTGLRAAWATVRSASDGLAVLVLFPAAALGLAFLVHQAGHLLTGWLAGFSLFGGLSKGWSAAGNLPVYEPVSLGILFLQCRKMQHLRRRLALVFSGGPFAGFIVAAGLEFGHDWSHSSMTVQYRVHLLAAFNLLVGLASLLPDTTRSGRFSDGARLLMLLKDDALAARLLSILQMHRAMQKGVHPRKWDPELVARATAVDDDTRDAVAGRWLAYLCAAERQDITSATKYLEDALAVPGACSARLLQRLFLEAAVFQAWFRDNPGKARAWATQLDQRRLAGFEKQRLNIALLWADGKLFDAFERLAAYSRALEQLPASPARQLAEESALDWKHQMESRMLTRAWRSMYTMSQQVDSLTPNTVSTVS
jgi:hypothetical protein